MEKQILIADEGMVLTDGEVYGTRISLGVGRYPAEFYQITKAEYDKIMEYETSEADEATEADYQAALQEFGVEV